MKKGAQSAVNLQPNKLEFNPEKSEGTMKQLIRLSFCLHVGYFQAMDKNSQDRWLCCLCLEFKLQIRKK